MANKINSNDGLKGIIKKLGYWLMVLVSFAAGYWFIAMGQLLGIDLKITSLLGWFVLASLTVNELRSILENFVEAGYNVPKILIKGLEVANRAFNEDPDVNDDSAQGKT
jgi:phage-related holin